MGGGCSFNGNVEFEKLFCVTAGSVVVCSPLCKSMYS